MYENQPRKAQIELIGSHHEQCATWVYLWDDGKLVVYFYDYSSGAEDHFGHDVGYYLFVETPDEKAKIMQCLDDEGVPATTTNTTLWSLGDGDADIVLLARLERRFNSYFSLQKWFTANEITFRKEFDSWA